MDASGSASVDGSGDRNFTVSGGHVAATFQKKSDLPVRLIVSILDQNGALLATKQTTAAYGVVTVSASAQ